MIAALVLPLIVLIPEGEWQLAERKGDLEVWTRERDGSSFQEVLARVRITAAAERVVAVLEDVERYREFMPYLEAASVLERVGDSILYQYQKVDPPVLSARDVVMRVEIERSTRLYRRRYRAAFHPSSPPEDEDTVRLRVLEGEWVIRSLGDDESELSYRVFTDPGGNIPAWVANYGNTISIPRLMNAVRERVSND